MSAYSNTPDEGGPYFAEHGFGELLRRHREAAALTQEELAERSGLTSRAISSMERSRTARPYGRSVRLLADALNLPAQARRELLDAARAGARGADRTRPASVHSDGGPGGGDSDPAVPRQLPAAVSYFVGRADELHALAGILDEPGGSDGSVMIAVISGTAGVGKTALAMYWAHLVAARFTDGQLYVNMHGFDPSRAPVTPADAVRGLLDALGVPAERIPPTAEAQQGLYRSRLANRRVLIVLDNAHDADQVRPLLPGSRGCLVVVTSRNQLAGLSVAEGARQVSLDVLTYGEARHLLDLRLGAQRLASDPEAADKLVELCARLPLALCIAAARAAARPDFPLAVLAAELQNAVIKLDVLDGGDAASNVRAAFSWSYENLSEQAARMFRLAGLFSGPDVTLPVAASLAGVPVRQARHTLAVLARAHMLAEHAPGRYICHDLLRAYASEQASELDTGADRRAALSRLLDHYLRTARAADGLLYPARRPIKLAASQPGVTLVELSGHGQALAWLDAEYRGLLAAVSLAADGRLDIHAWQLAWTLETFLYRRGHWHDWAATQHTALAAAQRLGDQYAQTQAHCGIANAQIELGRPNDALGHLAKALRLRKEAGDLAGQARIHLYASRALEHQGHYCEALSRSRRGLRLSLAAGDQAKPVQADALNAIGWELAMLGSYQQALGYCQQALDLHRHLGDRHSEPSTLDSLAYAHQHLGHHAEAADCYSRAVDLLAELGYSYKKAETLTYAGDAHHANGDQAAARDAWTQALAILDDLHHPDSEQVHAKLARLT